MIKRQDPQPIQRIWQEQVQQNQENLIFMRALWQNGRLLYDRFQNNYRHLLALPRKSQRIIQRKIAPSLAAAALILSLGVFPMRALPAASIIIVDGVTCTLEDAITSANSDTAVNGCVAGSGTDTIELQTNTALSAGLPAITSSIIINGQGNSVDGQGISGITVLIVSNSGELTLNETTITGGNSTTNAGGIANNGGTLTLNDSTISGNNTSGSGGGILNLAGTVTINNSTISDNTVFSLGGGIRSEDGVLLINNSTISGNHTTNGSGGGLFNSNSDVTVNQSTISGNYSRWSGGGISTYASYGTATLQLNQTIVSGNTVDPNGANVSPEIYVSTYYGSSTLTGNNYNIIGQNGNSGIHNYDGTVNIGGSGDNIAPAQSLGQILQATISGNPVLANHGGSTDTILLVPSSIAVNAIPVGSCSSLSDQRGVTRPIGDNCDVGAVEADFGDQCTLSDAIIAANTDAIAGNCPAGSGHDIIQLGGDELLLTPLPQITSQITIEGNGFAIDGNRSWQAFIITAAGDLTLNDIILRNALATQTGGGAIRNQGVLTINNSVLHNNSVSNAIRAGGGALLNTGQLFINNSTIKNSSAAFGGGLLNLGPAIINNSTLNNNRARSGSGGAIGNDATITLTKVTISDNSAEKGGGIMNFHTLTLNQSTISGNSATIEGGGLNNFSYYYNPSTSYLNQTIIAGNNAPAGAEISQISYGYASTVIANNHTLIGHSGDSGILLNDALSTFLGGNNGDIISPTQTIGEILTVDINDDPLLTDNGGATETIALPLNSPAADAGDPTYPELPNEYDQRGVGYPRVTNGRLDIGPYERDVRGITVNIAGNGSGSVSSDPAGISCESDCSETYDLGTVITLTAVISPSSLFTGWTGSIITTTNPLVLTLDEAKNVTATFPSDTQLLTVNLDGNGSVSSDPAGISCESDCSETYDYGAVITLTAASTISTTFTGWTGSTITTTNPITLTMDEAKDVTATFTVDTYDLTVNLDGDGYVSSDPAGIDCDVDCSETYEYGTVVTLTAVSTISSTFTGWTGSTITTTNPITLTMDEAKDVTATFAVDTYDLTVNLDGDGYVSSDPAGIDCDVDCSETYEYGTVVTLTAVSTISSTFTGWTGSTITTTNPLVLTIDEAKDVTATFTVDTYDLTVNLDGDGYVSSDPAGIDCDVDCSETYEYGTVVTLTAVSTISTTFTGWTGSTITTTNPLVLTIDEAKDVTATFAVDTYDLTINLDGNGSVSSDPAGISCESDCSETYEYGTVVTLTAVSDPDSTFVGWSGDCTGTGSCVVTTDMAKNVTATFKKTEFYIFLPVILK